MSFISRNEGLYRVLRAPLLNGTSKDMCVDGSSSPVQFSLSGQANHVTCIREIRFLLKGQYLNLDSKDFSRFGTATSKDTPLPNGLLLHTTLAGTSSNLFYDPVRTLGDFLDYADDLANLTNFSGSNDHVSFFLKFSQCLRLGSPDDVLVCTVQDDLTSLVSMHVMVSGCIK